MFCVLVETLRSNVIIAQQCVMGQPEIFLNDLLRCSTHTTDRSGAIENTIYDVSGIIVAPTVIIFISRTGFV